MSFAGQDRNARLRQALRPYRAKSDAFATSLFAADFGMYVAATAVAAAHAPLLIRLAAATAAGVLLAVLFVVGHDACHGSYTSRRWLNSLLGRIAFLPTVTPLDRKSTRLNSSH